MGVRRAVDTALDAPGNHKTPIQTFGPLIHNPQVMSLLEEKGISVITKIPSKGSGTILIRAHGVPPKIKQDLIDAGFDVLDATCPRVIKSKVLFSTMPEKTTHPLLLVIATIRKSSGFWAMLKEKDIL